jgi:transcriptional regulator with XRE-family HTH domain
MDTVKILQPAAVRNPVCTALGINLKRIRISAQKSQEDLAVEAEVDRTYISSIERGVANPSLLTLANICVALNISLSALLESVDLFNDMNETSRRANNAQPQPREKKSRLK